jgi:hypothetical protein
MARGLQHLVPIPVVHEDGSTSKSPPLANNHALESESIPDLDPCVLDLDFSPGLGFARKVRSELRATVHPDKLSYHFTMVVSFGRSIFKLTEDNVSMALESVIGGRSTELIVSI